MTNIFIAFFAYLIDSKFGEFSFIRHPVIIMGDVIHFFEKNFYKDSISRGFLLVVFTLGIVGFTAYLLQTLLHTLPYFLELALCSFIASMFLAHRMLRDSVLGVLEAEDKKHAIAMLVSRDTEDMNESDVYKAAIETYGENLSDGVIAPLFYLLLFGLPGIILYKAINTMDSMIGYRNRRYEKYGKVAALLDDVANFLPSRLTALLIMLKGRQKYIFAFYKDGSKHDSPNAGHPITAMALVLGLKLGGDTAYFGAVKKKANFGHAREEIRAEDVKEALGII